MKEVKKEIKAYEIHAMCECGGEFKVDPNGLGLCYDTIPPSYSYLYICNKCKKEEFLARHYPYVAYETHNKR